MSSSSSSDICTNAPATYKWEIDNFVNVTDSKFAPEAFNLPNNERGIYFKLLLHPKLSVPRPEMSHLVVGFSIFSSGRAQFPLHVLYRLWLLGANGEMRNIRAMSAVFTDRYCVDTQYNLNWDYLTASANGLLVNGKLTIYCEAHALGSVDRSLLMNSNMNHHFGLLLENEKFADVTLLVGGKEFKAHKLVLATRSPVFCAMFEHAQTKESLESRVHIDDMEVEVFEQLIHFIYTDKVPEGLDIYAVELLQAADRYQLDLLKYYCEHYLCKYLTVESVASCAVIADMHGAKMLEKQCIEYLFKHANQVTQTDGWKNLVESRPKLACQLYQFVIDMI